MATPTTLPAAFVSGNILTAAQMNDLRGAFRVLQVVSTVKTDTFTMASTTFADVTGLSVSITPQSATSKILVISTVSCGSNYATNAAMLRLMRDSTAIFVGDSAGSRTQASNYSAPDSAGVVTSETQMFLDSPATTSATTYKIQIRSNAAGTSTVNRSYTDNDSTANARLASSITVLEISA